MQRTKSNKIDIPEDLSGEIWKTSTEDFVLHFLDNGGYEIKEKGFVGRPKYNASGALPSIEYGYDFITHKGNYRVAVNTNTVFLDVGKDSTIHYKLPSEIRFMSIDEKKSNDAYLITLFQDNVQVEGNKKEKYAGSKMLLERTKPSQQQKIDKLLERLNSWPLQSKFVAEDVDAYERPYAHSNYITSGETNAWVSTLKNQLYQLGATVIWNEKKKLYELETNQHLIARRAFVEVYVAKTLYQSEKALTEYFLKITVKNTGKEMIGFHLSHKENNIFFANQWGKYAKPFRRVIDERRIIFKNENLTPIIQQFKDGLLQTIKPNQQLDYYINLNGSNNKLILDDKSGFFIVTIDGQMKFTDGKMVELISLENEEDEVRAIVFPLPATIETVPEKQWMFIDKVMNEHRH